MTHGNRLRSEKIASFFIRCSVGVFIVFFLSILIAVAIKGLPAFSFDIIFRLPESGFYLGKEGGVLNAIVGSLMVAGGATLLAALIAVPLVLYINIYLARGSRIAAAVRFALDVLWGIPSIVYGAAGVAVMLLFSLRGSLLAAILVVAVIEIPILARAVDEVVRMVPRELEEAALSLGAGHRTVAYGVAAREALPGIITALLLAFGRGIGDAAAVLLVAGFQDGIPASLFEPVATLPLSIFYLVNTPFPEVRARGYAASLVLIVIIIVISLLSRLLAGRFSRFRVDR
jgi:phosphate transport system permease protein